MSLKSSLHIVLQAEPLYQPTTTAKRHPFTNSPNPISRLPQTIPTSTDETPICFTSLCFIQYIPALRTYPVSSVLLPEAAQAISLANGIYQLISRKPTMDFCNDNRTHGLSLSTIGCQACVLPPSCASTNHINRGDLVLSSNLEACKTTPETYIAKTKLAHPLNQVFQHVLIDRLNFPSYSNGAARKSIPEGV